MALSKRARREAIRLKQLGAEARADHAALEGQTATPPPPPPDKKPPHHGVTTLPEPLRPALHDQLDFGFPYPLYEWRRHIEKQIEKLEFQIGQLSEALHKPGIDYRDHRSIQRRLDNRDAELDSLQAQLNPVDHEGVSLLIDCRYAPNGCPEKHPRATAHRRGGRCALCFLSALDPHGRPREFRRTVGQIAYR